MTSRYTAVLVISIGRMHLHLLAPTLDDDTDYLFALVIAPSFYLHQIEVVDQDPASGILQANVTGKN